MNPNGYIRTIHDLDEKQIRMLDNGGVFVVLTPDDIITLKLLRDEFKSTRYRHKDDPNRQIAYYTEQGKLIETLERILKQVA